MRMIWQPSSSQQLLGLVSQKRKSGGPIGFRNLGNSCYLNSVLQCLTYTAPLAYFCLNHHHSDICDVAADPYRKRDCPFCILEKRIGRSLRSESAVDAPLKIHNCIRLFADHFRCGCQEDAHEFLRYVIDACHNTCLRLKKLRRKGSDTINGSTVVREIFGGALQSQIKCLSCGGESNKIDEIMDISLDILHSSSLKEAMQKFFQPETLDGNNKYKCEKCKKLVAAKKQMSIYQAPNVLVIQLKRFEGIYGGKIDKAIAFEASLALSSFLCKGSQDTEPEYRLFGSIVHSGYSPDSGHYYAYIKDFMGRWYCCNDTFVTLSTLQEVLSEKVYILFFSRTNLRPPSACTPLSSNGIDSHECNGNGETNGLRASNGVSSHDCNGNGASNGSKAVLAPLKLEAHAEHSSFKDMPTVSKVNKVPSSPRIKFNLPGTSSLKKVPPNGRADVHKLDNGNVMDPIQSDKIDGDVHSSLDNNGSAYKNVDTVSESDGIVSSANHKGTVQNGGLKHMKDDLQCGGAVRTINQENKHNELRNGSICSSSEISSSKRKLEDSCILLAKDAESRLKVEQLKGCLEKEAFSVLKSCGYSRKVHSFMHSNKRSCIDKVGSRMSSIDEIKKLLVGNAKRNFIPQIPEMLKENLIEHIRSFSQGNLK